MTRLGSIFLAFVGFLLCIAPVSAATNVWDNKGPVPGTKGSGIITFSGVFTWDTGWTPGNACYVFYWENSLSGGIQQGPKITFDTNSGKWSGSLTLTPGTTYAIFIQNVQTKAGQNPQTIWSQGFAPTAP